MPTNVAADIVVERHGQHEDDRHVGGAHEEIEQDAAEKMRRVSCPGWD